MCDISLTTELRAINMPISRASKRFSFLVAGQALSFLLPLFLLLSLHTASFYPFSFSLPSFPPFPFPFLPICCFFLFPCFLLGKFEHFSYFLGSAATSLRRTFEALRIDTLCRFHTFHCSQSGLYTLMMPIHISNAPMIV